MALNPFVGYAGPNYLGAGDHRGGGGAFARAGSRAYGGGGRSPLAQAAYSRAQQAASVARPTIPGTPDMDAAILPAAFPVLTFALADGINIKTVTMNPQTALRGQRLFATVLRVGAAYTAPLLTTMLVGQKPVIVTPDGVPLEALNQTAFDMNVLFPPSQPGVLYQASVRMAVALTGTDTITIIFGVHGSAVL